MSATLIGKKIGMTRLFDDKGISTPVTVVSLYDLVVCDLRTEEKNGYNAVVFGYDTVKDSKINKPQNGFFKKHNLEPMRKLFEVRVNSLDGFEIGKKFDYSDIDMSKKIKVIGTSIGKGFAGAMKRHNFAGLRASHGVSISHRSHGSTGACQDPGKVFKNKKMAGQMGNKRVTVKNLSVARYDEERNLLFIAGSVPGAKSSNIKIVF